MIMFVGYGNKVKLFIEEVLSCYNIHERYELRLQKIMHKDNDIKYNTKWK